MVKLGIYATGATLIGASALAFLLGVRALEIAGALCLARD